MSDFNKYLDTIGEFGVITKVNHPIAMVEGLPKARLNEIVLLESGHVGQVYAMEENVVEILIFSKDPVRVGTRVTRTDKTLSVPMGPGLLGNIIDPLGQSISSSQSVKKITEERQIDVHPRGIDKRARIKEQFYTGISLIDMMIPLGRGQKELVLGDRKTGKSTFLTTTVKNQVRNGTIAIYAAIGKKKSDIKALEEHFKREKIFDKIVIVASSSYDSPSLIYITPYTAMTIAEYFADLGNDTVVILDDLSTHAKFYREISLLAKHFPGRDSYPGDIFYTHARLLERSGNFKHPTKGTVSITCLPVAETVEGDLTGYIATNLMGMTDGHIYFDSNIYYKGRRPAINIPLSVTRVGRQTQTKAKQDINRELTSFLTLYDKMQNLSHFGAELVDAVKNVLKTGEKIYTFFDQPHSFTVSNEIQIVLFSLLWLNLFSEEDEKNMPFIHERLALAYEDPETKKIFASLIEGDSFNDILHNISSNKERLLEICRGVKTTANSEVVENINQVKS